MTNHRIIKFLAGCGIASLLLASCGSSSNSSGSELTAITTPVQAAAASAAVMTFFNGDFAPDPARDVPMNSCVTGTINITPLNPDPVTGDYNYTVRADNCSNNITGGTLTINGSFSGSQVTNATTGLATRVYRAGDMNGVASPNTDLSYTFDATDPALLSYVEVEDTDIQEQFYNGVQNADYSIGYSGFKKGQTTRTEGGGTTVTTDFNVTSNGTNIQATDIFTDQYAYSGNIKFSSITGAETTSTALTLNRSGTFTQTPTYEEDAPNGRITIQFTLPPASANDCSNASGSYAVTTLTPIRTIYASDGITDGRMVINGNTTILFTPVPVDQVEVTLAGETAAAYGPGPISTLIDTQSTICPLIGGTTL